MPWRSLISPVVRGVEHLPSGAVGSRPILFVGNHTLMGLYDLPVLLMELYMRGFKVCVGVCGVWGVWGGDVWWGCGGV